MPVEYRQKPVHACPVTVDSPVTCPVQKIDRLATCPVMTRQVASLSTGQDRTGPDRPPPVFDRLQDRTGQPVLSGPGLSVSESDKKRLLFAKLPKSLQGSISQLASTCSLADMTEAISKWAYWQGMGALGRHPGGASTGGDAMELDRLQEGDQGAPPVLAGMRDKVVPNGRIDFAQVFE